MAYIYGLVDSLQGKDQVGDGECVTLVKQYAHLGVTGTWKQGRKVLGISRSQGDSNRNFC